MDGVRAATQVAVPFAVRNAGQVRHRLRDEMRVAGVGSALAADVEIILGELLGNALLHGEPRDDGSVGVAWLIADAGQVRVAVTDGGRPVGLHAYDAPSFAGTGRGLRIVAELAADWGVELRDPGVTVWALVTGR